MTDKQQFLRGLNYALGKAYVARDAAVPFSPEWRALRDLATSLYETYERFERHGAPSTGNK